MSDVQRKVQKVIFNLVKGAIPKSINKIETKKLCLSDNSTKLKNNFHSW